MALPYTFSVFCKVRTKVDLVVVVLVVFKGQHSRFAPMGRQNKATVSSRVKVGLFVIGYLSSSRGLYDIKSARFIDFLKHKNTSDPTIPLFKLLSI